MNNPKTLGGFGEKCALDFMEKKGFSKICRNYHSRYGEIDIILENSKYIVFVEVKTRNKSGGVEAVDLHKRLKIIKTAFDFLMKNPVESEKQPRFDIIEVNLNKDGLLKKINHYKNAFSGEEYYALF